MVKIMENPFRIHDLGVKKTLFLGTSIQTLKWNSQEGILVYFADDIESCEEAPQIGSNCHVPCVLAPPASSIHLAGVGTSIQACHHETTQSVSLPSLNFV